MSWCFITSQKYFDISHWGHDEESDAEMSKDALNLDAEEDECFLTKNFVRFLLIVKAKQLAKRMKNQFEMTKERDRQREREWKGESESVADPHSRRNEMSQLLLPAIYEIGSRSK
ncbi:hypothetical protein RUM44_002888 [Polyplax serrata]|uniref:Uncharacterized protein n=1 Tax=Polyplax serrata TaxID=468196 RepID=A0ABR1AWZ4_POLSC